MENWLGIWVYIRSGLNLMDPIWVQMHQLGLLQPPTLCSIKGIKARNLCPWQENAMISEMDYSHKKFGDWLTIKVPDSVMHIRIEQVFGFKSDWPSFIESALTLNTLAWPTSRPIKFKIWNCTTDLCTSSLPLQLFSGVKKTVRPMMWNVCVLEISDKIIKITLLQHITTLGRKE